jgi:hypothetical protein
VSERESESERDGEGKRAIAMKEDCDGKQTKMCTKRQFRFLQVFVGTGSSATKILSVPFVHTYKPVLF